MREEQDKEFQKKMSELIGGSHETSTSNINKDNDDHHDTDSNKTRFHTYAYNHDKIPKFPSMHFNSLNVGKAPRFDGISYTDWAYRMKMHLVSLHPHLWEMVDVGFTLLDPGREMTPKEAQDLYHNTQATYVILSCLNLEEFNKVNGVEIAKFGIHSKCPMKETRKLEPARLSYCMEELRGLSIYKEKPLK